MSDLVSRTRTSAKAKSKKVKTANGMGSIVLRSDGRWMARFTTTDPSTGLPLRKHLYAKTEQAARVALIDALADRNAGKLPVRRGRLPTLGEYVERWLAEKDPHLRPSVSKRYRELLGRVTRRFGRQRIDSLEGRHVNTLLAELHHGGLSARTCNHVRAVLRTVLNDARRERLVAFNAAEDARPLKLVDSADLAVLEPGDVKVLMAEGPKHRDYNLWVTGLGTAMRQGELLGLRWEAIDFGARLVRVTRTLSRVNGTWYVNPPKSLRSRRVLPLPRVVVEALQRQRDMQMADRQAAGRGWFGDDLGDLVFRNRDGSPMVGSNVTKRFESWLKRVGIRKLRFHDGTRASCATFLAVAGVPVATAQAILGHSASSLTLDIYTRVRPDLARNAADAMDAVFGLGDLDEGGTRAGA